MRTLLGVALLVGLISAPLLADEGWVIERMDITMALGLDGSIRVREGIDVDFRGLPGKHGILRDIARLQDFDREHYRRYDIALTGVTDATGAARQVATSDQRAFRRFRIGDPDRTVDGRESYRIDYTLSGALNPFQTHDELYWNVIGTWPVQIAAASVDVSLPVDAIERVACYQGPAGSTEPCRSSFSGSTATFAATRPLAEGEQLTVVVGLRKGAVAVGEPLLTNKPRALFGASYAVPSMFETTPWILTGAATGLVAVVVGVIALWWRVGRDRRSVSLYRKSAASGTERVPLFGARPAGVEFEPPDRIRPGQMGLLIDERADTLDVTATIVDLAVRGYLRITEIPKSGWFGKADWQLDLLKEADASLLEYERIVLLGLFGGKTSRKLSALKNSFYRHLARAKTALYEDAVSRGWFRRNPRTVRRVARGIGLAVTVAGLILSIAIGARWGAGLLGLPVAAGGLLLTVLAGAMPRRTPDGRELMRRTLGFAKYVRTGETQRQEFAERANIFTAYLPYAVMFRCVEKWASAFKDIDMQQATAVWYSGQSQFDPGHFSSSLSSFSSSVSSTIASTPGGSGGSGFGGGGSSGGGGGGGGGGSW